MEIDHLVHTILQNQMESFSLQDFSLFCLYIRSRGKTFRFVMIVVLISDVPLKVQACMVISMWIIFPVV
ncbi:hypothetical protein MKW98_002459 [Papaver atlanticum]|uniref:Uncharacterized protein n=1 Tax=Papaver atlanticum TaxID=357466 RepID=A0AAD4SBE0_9MAGN|nr:hypothetical protein MKW98_002459 [Papaver atlanticum]